MTSAQDYLERLAQNLPQLPEDGRRIELSCADAATLEKSIIERSESPSMRGRFEKDIRRGRRISERYFHPVKRIDDSRLSDLVGEAPSYIVNIVLPGKPCGVSIELPDVRVDDLVLVDDYLLARLEGPRSFVDIVYSPAVSMLMRVGG